MNDKFSIYKLFKKSSDSLLTNRKILVKSAIYEYDNVNLIYEFYYDHDTYSLYVVHDKSNTLIDLKGKIRKNGKISSVLELVNEFEEIFINDLNECIKKGK